MINDKHKVHLENMFKKEKIKIIILAAGKGKRMQSDLPKVLSPLKGTHMIGHLLETIGKVTKEKPIAIIGHQAELVKKELGDSCFYVLQKKQLGTGHAVICAQNACKKAKHLLVLSGDQPFISEKTLKNLIKKHLHSKAKITFAATKVPNFEDWRKGFKTFGRILRKNKKIIGIKEYKDANEKEKNIKEINTGCYVFDAKWLWKNLGKIKNKNIQKEYYLTDLLCLASNKNGKVETVKIRPREALGANTKEELELLEKLVV
ncbi:MAG: Bifunctional protein GlmU [Candidatus Nomurabacteria bacterium GW2011_GWB1_40_7]|uniref:Bifunctional protein GlmU n=1 Tax=Candidatus Nomurabacteria bacterium GW2011_GWB1_40_7 TaxID=1618744 RepID=A0A0G0W5N2_9BACT|nr:MAG: Bifunctional protein GlmU [Candidatus Nomurabacteria bacterium GW2011_GWB1_40_7]